MRYMNTLLVENEDVFRWNWVERSKKGRERQTQFKFTRSDARHTKEEADIEILLQLTDHAQLNFYVPCWALYEVRPTPIEPVVLALHICYNK